MTTELEIENLLDQADQAYAKVVEAVEERAATLAEEQRVAALKKANADRRAAIAARAREHKFQSESAVRGREANDLAYMIGEDGTKSEPQPPAEPSEAELELAALRKQIADNNAQITELIGTAKELMAQRMEAASAAPAPAQQPPAEPIVVAAPSPTPEPEPVLAAAPKLATDEVFDDVKPDQGTKVAPAATPPPFRERVKSYFNEKKDTTPTEGK